MNHRDSLKDRRPLKKRRPVSAARCRAKTVGVDLPGGDVCRCELSVGHTELHRCQHGLHFAAGGIRSATPVVAGGDPRCVPLPDGPLSAAEIKGQRELLRGNAHVETDEWRVATVPRPSVLRRLLDEVEAARHEDAQEAAPIRAITLSEPELRDLLNEVQQLREQRDALQARSTEQLEEVRVLKAQLRRFGRRSQVTQFHLQMNAPVKVRPEVPSDDRVRLRLRLIAEEFFELLEAALHTDEEDEEDNFVRLRGDVMTWLSDERVYDSQVGMTVRVKLPAFVDALADLDYVIEGTRLEFGVDGEPVFALVHEANMAKVGGETRSDGKKLKPEGWQPADISRELRRQGWSG